MFKPVVAAYDDLAENYGASSKAAMSPNHLHVLRQKAAASLMAQHFGPGHSMLEVGCGYGLLLDYLKDAETSPNVYCGIDPSTKLIDLAKQKYGDRVGVSFHVSDLETWAFAPHQQFEVAVTLGLAAHLKPTDKALQQFASVLTSLATRAVIVEFQDVRRYKGQFTAFSKEQVTMAFGRKVSPTYTVENPEDSTFTTMFLLQ